MTEIEKNVSKQERYPVIVGVISDGDVKSELSRDNHEQLGFRGKRWRYNPKSKIVYWWAHEISLLDKELVEDHLIKKYNFSVIKHIPLRAVSATPGAGTFEKCYRDAHGHVLKESDNRMYNTNKFWWMSPDLKFYNVNEMGHWVYANDYLKSIGKGTDKFDLVYPIMYSLGWIRVCRISHHSEDILTYNYNSKKPPTSKQIKALKDWAIEKECYSMRDDTTGKRTELLEQILLKEEIDRPYGGWLSPDLKFFPVEYEGHGPWARLNFIYKLDTKELSNNTYNTMFNHGWLRIWFGDDKLYYNSGEPTEGFKRPSQRQMKALEDLAIEYECTKLVDSDTNKERDVNSFLEEWGTDENDKPYGGWLDPNGKFHKVGYQQHSSWASDYLRRSNHPNVDPWYPYSSLYSMNWVRVIFEENALDIEYRKEKPPTSKQKLAIKDLAIEYGCDEIYDTITKQTIGGFLQEGLGGGEGVKKPNVLYVGYILPEDNFKIIGYDAYKYYGHYEVKQKHPELDQIEMKLAWRYRKDYNTVFWWNRVPGRDITDVLDDWIEKKTGKTNPKHVRMSMEDTQLHRLSHNVDESVRFLLKKGIKNFRIVEGWVAFGDEGDDWKLYKKDGIIKEYGNVFSHSWIEFDNERIFDPGIKQWKKWKFNLLEGKIAKIKAKYLPEEYFRLSENLSYADLLQLTRDDRKHKGVAAREDRAKNVRVRSLPVSMDENLESWNFRYKSSPQTTVTDKPFRGSITFLKGEVGPDDDAEKLECKVDCECPDFMYRFAYNDTAQGASEVGNDSLSGCINRRPKPAYDYGEGLCKHLIALGKYLQTQITNTKKSNLFEAIGDVAKQGPFNITYYD